MERSTDYLKQILHVVASIDQTMKMQSAASGEKPGSGIVGGKPGRAGSQLGQLAGSLPGVAKGIKSMADLKPKTVKRAINNLEMIYNFLDKTGDGRKAKKIDRSLKMFEHIGTSLRKIERPIRSISNSLITISLGIVAFAGSLVLAGMLLGVAGGDGVMNFLITSIIGIVMVFGVLALANKVVDKGTDTIKGIGFGMAALSLGIVSFALAIAIVPMILGASSVLAGVLMISGIIVLAGLVFAGLGFISGLVQKGAGVAGTMALGMIFLAGGVLVMALAAKALTSLGGEDAVNKKGEKRGKFGQLMSDIGPGLGVMGIVLVSSALLFAGMGALAPVLLPGIGVGIAMAAGLILLSASVKKLVDTAAGLGTKEEIRDSVGKTIGGVLTGFLDGIGVLSEGKTGLGGIKAFIKNSAEIFAGTAVLLSMSLALSQFAKALTAFSEFENMRVIEGYDSKGKPIFGDKINIRNVADNINYSISTFLTSLLASTDGLSKREAKALKKMGRALTGRRGILSAVIQFASVLKTFAQFGPEGKIGFVDMIPDGTDEDGNAKFKEVASSVFITDVVGNIVNSFGLFAQELSSRGLGMTRREGKKMTELAEALLGKKGRKGKEKYGLLQPIQAFSETLSIYAKFGTDNMIPILDADGNVIDKISVTQIAKNIIRTLTAFTQELGSRKLKQDTKQAEDNLKIFDDIVSRTDKIATSMDGLSRFSNTIGELASNIGLLSSNLGGLNVEKLTGLSDIGTVYLAKTNDYGVANERITKTSPTSPQYSPSAAASPASSSRSSGPPSGPSVKEPNWELIAAQIGESVGSQLTNAMKAGQIKFTFSSAGGNQGVIEFD